MNLFSPNPIPPQDTWDTLRDWRMLPFKARYLAAISFTARLMTLVVGLAGIALFFVEPSIRTVVLIVGLWLFSVPTTALGYLRKMDRMAANVPFSPATKSPTTTVDIRNNVHTKQ